MGGGAVYVGLKGWGRGEARGELTWEELVACQRRVASAGRELQVALNIIPKPQERARLFERFPPLLDLGIRTLIVNDIGILQSLRRRFPALRLTASIGCGAQTVCNVALFQDLGADAVILPGTVGPDECPGLPVHVDGFANVYTDADVEVLRGFGAVRFTPNYELSLDEIHEIATTCGTPMELLVHGKMPLGDLGLLLPPRIRGELGGQVPGPLPERPVPKYRRPQIR